MSDPRALLEQLRTSGVFADDFPRRPRHACAQFLAPNETEKREPLRLGIQAIERIGAPQAHLLAGIARKLGQARYEDAVPILAELWRNCALSPLRTAAGHALREIGSQSARAALWEMLDDSDHLSSYLGVRAYFDDDPLAAFDRLAPYFEPDRVRQPGGSVIANTALGVFGPGSFTISGPQWNDAPARDWLQTDPRWFDLCIRLRHDPNLGESARYALRHADPARVDRALAEAVEREGPRYRQTRSAAFGDLVSRYEAGECVAVWETLRSFDAVDGDLREEALAVARVTMQRVAHNLDLLASRLAGKGWIALSGRLRTPPAKGDVEVFREIERITKGPLPPSLQAFWEVVGGVDFVWDYNTGEPPPEVVPGFILELDGLDPISVDVPGDSSYLLEEWEETVGETHPELLDPFSLDLAPDYLHKANISGGAPYGVELPYYGADPVFANEEHLLPFVDYLRLCLKWGGFSLLEKHEGQAGVSELVAFLTDGFERF